MHVTVGTLFLAFCWVRHLLASILPAEFARPNASAAVTVFIPVLKFFMYEPMKGAV